jgi:signal transduction histidine kinase
MKIRHKLTLLFTAITTALMLVFALVIYWAYAENREDEFYKRLRQQAITKANLLLDARVSPETLQTIYRNTHVTTYPEEVAIYDTAFNLLYHDAVDIDFVKETETMLNEIRSSTEIQFVQDGWQVVGFLFHHQDREYVITAAAYDDYGYSKLANLRLSMIIALLAGSIVVYLSGRFFSRQALKPVSAMVDKVEEITATNLDLRVAEGNGKDEIAELAVTFNRMLDRLENSFDAQKEFVSNISHELRTPLAAIIAELELAQNGRQTAEAYRQAVSQALNDARRLARLSTGLLDMAKASYDQTEITFKEVRIDELLLDAQSRVIQLNPDYQVNLAFEQEIEDDTTLVQGNEYLLRTVFMNLMENGCKFSPDRQSDVCISFAGPHVILRFSDRGIGIPPEDLPHIFTPFYRGTNKGFAEGNGIGLSLVRKIIQLHAGAIAVESAPETGTVFTVRLQHL